MVIILFELGVGFPWQHEVTSSHFNYVMHSQQFHHCPRMRIETDRITLTDTA